MSNHLAATLVGRHGLKQAALTVEHAYAGRTVHLVGRADKEVGVEVAHVDFEVGSRLRTVDKYGYAVAVGDGNHFLHGIDRTQHVGDVGEGDEAGVLREEVAVEVEIQLSVLIDFHHFDADALALLEQLPGHDVGVVLHDGEDNLIAVAETLAVGGDHEVDGLGRAAGEDDFLFLRRVEEGTHFLARVLLHFGGFLRKLVHAAVHVGFLREIHFVDSLYHATRCLRGGRRVKIDERAAAHLA